MCNTQPTGGEGGSPTVNQPPTVCQKFGAGGGNDVRERGGWGSLERKSLCTNNGPNEYFTL